MSEEEFKAKYEELKSNPMYQTYCAMLDTKNKIIEKLQQENKQLKEKINTYEDPEDMTLMFMWCEEKAKDKIKQLKEVIEEVREVINKMVHYGYEKNGTYYMRTTDNSEFGARAEILLQILDKAKENK